MAKPFDYSKWDRLELSDDEDTFHPNLDKGLNIRVNRITRDRKEEEIDTKKKELLEAGKSREADKLEKKRPLHLGNVCRVSEDRTIIKSVDGSTVDRTRRDEEFSVDEYTEFKMKNKKLLDAFTEASWEQSREMLMVEGAILMDDYTNNYFMLTTLEEEMKGNRERVEKLGRQGQILSQIHQLAEPMKRPPRDLIPRFFEKFERPESRAAFQEGVDHFLKQIAKRAVQKKEEEQAAAEEEARKAAELENAQPVSLVEAMYQMSVEERMGPGGLDPVEVFESLPEKLQECFKSGDVELLKQTAQEMPTAEFEHHFQRCIDSGLWTSG
mmetsp:Transcript_17711/g.41173  ORF Transcript_17711/g.41173 Transcript_17711/m.41173 type:complete len:326 (+) Transcript_17711:93-1070(+)|eukprot:CAMPEP_0178417184 /NCGR_PEP_ID=MMETSP0689_2-20121128/24444_1 /TAXON_ID=160604 /ORGANISM="Amphidinium massartii, Strain CS-259" /LENGTH=325 /DNA_ID=CAMNT_0020038543 /DNA_START=87 /DNA_END=1064 /DNA_ORIENTATION=+